jgi:glycine betaine/proline transport system ATP-binding protein
VADASLDVGEGEIVVLMGLSGSGKSTLLRAVNGLNPVARGGVVTAGWIASCDVGLRARDRPSQAAPGECAMVFQQFALLPWRTVADNVGFGLELAGMTRATAKRASKAA